MVVRWLARFFKSKEAEKIEEIEEELEPEFFHYESFYLSSRSLIRKHTIKEFWCDKTGSHRRLTKKDRIAGHQTSSWSSPSFYDTPKVIRRYRRDDLFVVEIETGSDFMDTGWIRDRDGNQHEVFSASSDPLSRYEHWMRVEVVPGIRFLYGCNSGHLYRILIDTKRHRVEDAAKIAMNEIFKTAKNPNRMIGIAKENNFRPSAHSCLLRPEVSLAKVLYSNMIYELLRHHYGGIWQDINPLTELILHGRVEDEHKA